MLVNPVTRSCGICDDRGWVTRCWLTESEVKECGLFRIDIKYDVWRLSRTHGVFRDMHVEIDPVNDSLTLNIKITPTWQPRIEKFVIDEIAFEGYERIDVDTIRWYLSQKGLSVDVPLLRSPLLDIQSIIQVAFHESYSSSPKTVKRFEKLVSKASFRVKVVAPERVKITITPGRRQLCQ
uniref:Uncharacterized protein n=1 Tax=Oscillatoriales cyanobacterium SpSt-418 TaxID=2282169 RepID=A0A7C3PGX1_9CYAN